MSATASDGSTASYYELPQGATQLQDLISHRNMNSQDGEIFRAIYRKGLASHSDALRDARKVLFYAQAEVKRLEALEKPKDAHCGGPLPTQAWWEATLGAAVDSVSYVSDGARVNTGVKIQWTRDSDPREECTRRLGGSGFTVESARFIAVDAVLLTGYWPAPHT